MAERRMFSRTVTGSARFLKMSAQARALYYDLGMEADDDGFAEAFVRLRLIGVGERYLRELEKNGFLEILNEDLVVHITEWERNNFIRKDRYYPSVYLTEFPQYAAMHPEALPDDSPVVDQTADRRETEVRLGKDSPGKDSQEKTNSAQYSSVQSSTAEVRTDAAGEPPMGRELRRKGWTAAEIARFRDFCMPFQDTPWQDLLLLWEREKRRIQSG